MDKIVEKLIEQIDETIPEEQLPQPFNGRLLVEMVGYLKSSSLAIPNNLLIRDMHGALRVKIIAIDPNAFKADHYKRVYDGGHLRIPKVGDEVIIVGHAGCPIPNSKGRYQLITDDNIVGVYPKQKAKTVTKGEKK